jgi:DNA modification methylase
VTSCIVYNRDACAFLSDQKFVEKPKLISADPPFNIGQGYSGYKDNLPRQQFDEFTLEWVENAWECCGGVLALHGPDDLAEMYLNAARMYDMPRVAWINICYGFGQNRWTNWVDGRCHCLIFAKDPKNYTFNVDDVLVPSARKLSGDKRIGDSPRAGMRLPSTVWGFANDCEPWEPEKYFGRVQGNNKERVPERPNQLPIAYLARLIRAYTNLGDLVCDPFVGTGTTALAAKVLGRDFVGTDLDSSAADLAEKRLSDAQHIAIAKERCGL